MAKTITITALCERAIVNAVIDNAVGFSPTPSHGLWWISGEHDVRAFSKARYEALRKSGVRLRIARLFRPLDSLFTERMSAKEREQVKSQCFADGVGMLRELVKENIPFDLLHSDEMHEDLNRLWNASAPLFDKAVRHISPGFLMMDYLLK